MTRTVWIGIAVFVVTNWVASLIYVLLTPVLDEAGILAWAWWDQRFWIEMLVHAVVLAIVGFVYCRWFAGRVKKTIESEQ